MDEIDALVLLSGDGLLHEVYNGFAYHEDPMKAFAIPVAPIPTGSGNGMAINLLGLQVRVQDHARVEREGKDAARGETLREQNVRLARRVSRIILPWWEGAAY